MQPTYSFSSVTRHVVSLFAQGPTQRCRRLSRIVSSVRCAAASKAKRRPTLLPTEGCIELDSHADSIVLGTNCVILSHTGQSCEVMPYSDTYDTITNFPVVTGATLWTTPHDGDKFILILNEALWMGDTLQHTLVNPNQLRAYSTTVQDNPFAPSPLRFEPPTGPSIPLTTMGTVFTATLAHQVIMNYQPSLIYPYHPLRHGIHTMWSFRPIMWRRKNTSTSRRFHPFHPFLRPPMISP